MNNRQKVQKYWMHQRHQYPTLRLHDEAENLPVDRRTYPTPLIYLQTEGFLPIPLTKSTLLYMENLFIKKTPSTTVPTPPR
jgi:hypothetical protein